MTFVGMPLNFFLLQTPTSSFNWPNRHSLTYLTTPVRNAKHPHSLYVPDVENTHALVISIQK